MSIFTEDQVASINAYQNCGMWHPFTCRCGSGALIATVDGLVCSKACGYTQDWVHGFMADWTWKEQLDLLHQMLMDVGNV
jgi:hypothetical protein